MLVFSKLVSSTSEPRLCHHGRSSVYCGSLPQGAAMLPEETKTRPGHGSLHVPFVTETQRASQRVLEMATSLLPCYTQPTEPPGFNNVS